MWLSGEWSLERREFEYPSSPRIAPENANFEIFAIIPEFAGVQSRFVNFQKPLERFLDSFATMDGTLDLIVEKDFKNWEATLSKATKTDESNVLANSWKVYK